MIDGSQVFDCYDAAYAKCHHVQCGMARLIEAVRDLNATMKFMSFTASAAAPTDTVAPHLVVPAAAPGTLPASQTGSRTGAPPAHP